MVNTTSTHAFLGLSNATSLHDQAAALMDAVRPYWPPNEQVTVPHSLPWMTESARAKPALETVNAPMATFAAQVRSAHERALTTTIAMAMIGAI